MSFRGGEIEFVLLLILLLFFGFLGDVVTRQTKQLPPKSLQIKGAFAHDGGGRQTIIVRNEMFGKLLLPGAAAL